MAERDEPVALEPRFDPVLLKGFIDMLTLHQEGLQKIKDRIGGAPEGVTLSGLSKDYEYLRRDVNQMMSDIKEIKASLTEEKKEERKESKADDRTARALRLSIIGIIISGAFGLAAFVFSLITMFRATH